jgi:hypothetical protein
MFCEVLILIFSLHGEIVKFRQDFNSLAQGGAMSSGVRQDAPQPTYVPPTYVPPSYAPPYPVTGGQPAPSYQAPSAPAPSAAPTQLCPVCNEPVSGTFCVNCGHKMS